MLQTSRLFNNFYFSNWKLFFCIKCLVWLLIWIFAFHFQAKYDKADLERRRGLWTSSIVWPIQRRSEWRCVFGPFSSAIWFPCDLTVLSCWWHKLPSLTKVWVLLYLVNSLICYSGILHCPLIYLFLEVLLLDPLLIKFNKSCFIKQLILLIRFDDLVTCCNCVCFSGKDVVDDIMANMIDQKKTRRQVIRQLAHLDLIGSAKDLKVRRWEAIELVSIWIASLK